MPGIEARLDHIIILLPYQDIIAPPAWLTQHFTISPGGRHADGKTENRLILFRDGTYIELIAFIDDSADHRHGHWWDKAFGVVDFALTTTSAPLDHAALLARLRAAHSPFAYDDPRSGGRRRPDGVELKWRVTFPTGLDRGALPFWCEDVSPRNRRVPLSEAATTHPCGAMGMAGVGVEVEEDALDRLSAAWAAVLDLPLSDDLTYALGLPIEDGGHEDATVRLGRSDGDLALTLTLCVEGGKTPDAIRHKVDGGLVAIDFE